MSSITSRERLLIALTGRIPDRVPISTYELVGYNSKAFENNDDSYAKLILPYKKRRKKIIYVL